MNDLSPREIAQAMVELGAAKAAHRASDLLIRGVLAGALLAFATCLALEGALQTNVPLVGALIFPVGFALIVVLGLELLTGNFGLVPLAALAHRASVGQVLANWLWVFAGNMIGSLLFAGLFYVVLTDVGNAGAGALGDHIRALAESKTIAYEPYGYDGLVTGFVKAMLCNWMVCLGVIMGASSRSLPGKVLGCWLPIFAFFALGFEHCVVNMFVIPMGMMLGAKISFADWWYWNQIPVTLGNIVGGFLFTGLPLYWTYLRGGTEAAPTPAARMSFGPAE
jgi:formate/nitrite transporter